MCVCITFLSFFILLKSIQIEKAMPGLFTPRKIGSFTLSHRFFPQSISAHLPPCDFQYYLNSVLSVYAVEFDESFPKCFYKLLLRVSLVRCTAFSYAHLHVKIDLHTLIMSIPHEWSDSVFVIINQTRGQLNGVRACHQHLDFNVIPDKFLLSIQFPIILSKHIGLVEWEN